MDVADALFLLVSLLLILLIYPGELSHINPRFTRRLYDRVANGYDRKWTGKAYRDPYIESEIRCHAKSVCEQSGVFRVLDLGCGTGRGIRLIAPALPGDTVFYGVDSSAVMLERFRLWLKLQELSLSSRVSIIESDLLEWANQSVSADSFGLVLMLEVGEFISDFERVIRRVADVTEDGGGFILTRPANFWWIFFPGRKQSRDALTNLLVSFGFESPKFVKWRFRYELVLVKKSRVRMDSTSPNISVS